LSSQNSFVEFNRLITQCYIFSNLNIIQNIS